jgi:hypothetical protein
MKVARLMLVAGIHLTALTPCSTETAPVIHYAPAENLEHNDVALSDCAKHEIDMAEKMVKST